METSGEPIDPCLGTQLERARHGEKKLEVTEFQLPREPFHLDIGVWVHPLPLIDRIPTLLKVGGLDVLFQMKKSAPSQVQQG